MALCIRLKISLSPAVATTRDRILQRVENFISVSDNIQNFSDGGVDWLILKEDGVSSNNTSMDVLVPTEQPEN